MKSSSIQLSIVSVVHLLGVAQASAIHARSTCTDFTAVPVLADEPNSTFYTKPGLTFYASMGRDCPNGTINSCYVLVGGYITDGRRLNISPEYEPDYNTTDSIYATIGSAMNMQFKVEAVTPLYYGNYSLVPGVPGYVAFTTTYNCTSGYLSGCSNDTLNNVGLEACTPYYDAQSPVKGVNHLAGQFHEVQTDTDVVSRLSCNLANTTGAKEGATPASCSDLLAAPLPSTSAGSIVNPGLLLFVVGFVGLFNVVLM